MSIHTVGKSNEYLAVEHDARSVASEVRQGELSAKALLDDVIEAILTDDKEIGSFITVDHEGAQRQAHRIDELVSNGMDPGPLAGVPIAIKDNLCTRGLKTTCASRILGDWTPPYDATCVARIRRAGGVIVGKTNLDEFGMGSSTETSAFGPTRNPIDRTHVPGGSSGGSAAALAAKLALLALGSDTGGSVRQPAALCGLVGFKPTYGRVSRYGLVAYASSLDTVGELALNVADAALLVDVVSGHDPCDSTSIPGPGTSLLSMLERGVEGMRIGIVREMLAATDDLEISESVRLAANLLSSYGAELEEVSLPTTVTCLPAYYLIASSEASSNLARFDGVRYGTRIDGSTAEAMQAKTRGAGFGPEVKRRIMLGTFALSAGYYDQYYENAQRVRTLVARDFEKAFANFDALIAPVTPTTAFRFGERTDPYSMYQFDVCTVAVNLAGLPAISVPFRESSNQLPIGIQVIGPALGEAPCFGVARVLEHGRSTLRESSL